MARCVCGHKKKWHGKKGVFPCLHPVAGTSYQMCDCQTYREKTLAYMVVETMRTPSAILETLKFKPAVGVDIERVKGAVLALTNLRFGTTLRFAVDQGQVSRDEQWVAAAMNCEDYQKAIDIAIEGFISSVKVGDYDLHLEPSRKSDA